jgi:hypothetical protein
MKTSSRRTSGLESRSKDVDKLFLILTAVLGLFVRIFPVSQSDFPLVDGGLFYSMIRDLQAANFSWPVFTSYNHQQIPYAYPPFAIYFTGILNSLTHIPLLKQIQWQPVVINGLTIVVVYFFAKRFTQSSTKAWLSTLIFSLTPNSYWWQIIGGGITRTFGALFAFLFTYFAYRIFHDKDESLFGLVGTILSGSLVVLSHLEWALQAFFSAFLFFLFWGRNLQTARKAVIIFLSVLVLTSIWWIPVQQNFGLQIFHSVSTATDNRLLFFLPLFSLQFTGEYTTFIAVFVLIGAFVAIAKKEYFPLIWGAGCFLVDPRGAAPFSVLVFSSLAMITITELIAPFILKTANRADRPWWNFIDLPVGKLFLGVFSILCLSHALEMSNIISLQHLSKDERQAMLWVQNHLRYDDKFIVLGWEPNPIHSSVSEWFPALSDRQSLTTVQGQEWFGKYHDAIKTFSLYQQCLLEDVDCLQEIERKSGIDGNCLFISFEKSGQKPEDNSLYVSLERSPEFSQVYSLPTVKVFCR